MNKNKRGLSAVITTVLLILLGIAAIIIVWQVVRPAIESTAEDIQVKCLGVDMSASLVSCTTGVAKIRVTRNAGADITTIKVLVGDAAGTLATEEITSTDTGFPGELESADIDITVPTGKTANTVSVGTFIGEDNCGLAVDAQTIADCPAA